MQKDREQLKNEFKKRLYSFVLKLIGFLEKLPNDNITRRISDQVFRSGSSILSNYIEAQSAVSKKEFVSYFNISLRSTNESKMWFALLRDGKRIRPEAVGWFLSELDEFAKVFASSILTARGKRSV
jgi:four helix bundle protein